MSLIDQIKHIANFDYCKISDGKYDEVIPYEFGWKDGLHFYLDDYLSSTEYEGRFILILYLNKTAKFIGDLRTELEVLEKIDELAKLHRIV